MESQPTIRQRFNSDLQNRLALIAYVPILCLGVLAAGGLIFLQGSTGVRLFGIFALLGVALSVFIAYRTISSTLETIGQVAASARDLVDAQQSLLDGDTEPIEQWQKVDTGSDDELGQLAASVNAMHTNTVEVDRNQNDSIKKGISNIVINLARRSQALLDRQVEYIDVLESSEEDPDRLEQMFKIDHLATRMRRNAESLLVLADADPGRRRGGPVDVADVLRVAMGEIENYQHIELNSVEPGQVTSAGAVDLAHMAAELMENATQFSPPDAPVEVSGHLEDDHYLISIVDHGMGMPADQLEVANQTIANPPELGLAMGRSLGFVVIGRLANRLGAKVNLAETTESGVTASILVPTSIFSKVGDNSGVRRSIVAPDVSDSPVEESPAEDKGRSPALTKLLGLDAATLGSADTSADASSSGSDPTEQTEPAGQLPEWTPPPVTPDAPAPVEPVVEESGWTPPEVTPDVSLPAAEDSGWTPPEVTPDAPLESRRSVEPVVEESEWTPPEVTPDVSLADGEESDAPADETDLFIKDESEGTSPSETSDDDVQAEPESDEAVAAVDDEPVTADDELASTDDDEPASVDDEPETASQPSVSEPVASEPVVSDAAVQPETVPTGLAPSNLEEALPTGEAFESGMASLLDASEQDDSEKSDSSIEAAANESSATGSGLRRRRRGEVKLPTSDDRPVAASNRDPEDILENRSMLSRYREGIKGKQSPNTDPNEEG